MKPTYKELKPNSFISFPLIILSLKPTYKELKLDFCLILGLDKLGLKPTYKELKQAIPHIIVGIKLV